VIVRLVVKADATRVTGTGHVMRSCVIAESAISVGINTIFIGNLDGIEWLETKVEKIGFSQIMNNFSSFVLNESEDVLILDSYDSSDSWLLELNWLGKIVIVDPISPNFHADLRFHPGLEDDWTSSDESPFYGKGEFLLVRKELREVTCADKRDESLLKILVTGGGSDPYNFCGEISSVIAKFDSNFSVNIISDQSSLVIQDPRFSVYPTGESLVNLLPYSDLVLAPASTTCLEILTLGLPLGIACVVENQESNYQKLVFEELAVGIGRRSPDDTWEIDAKALRELINSKSLRNKLSDKSLGKYNSRGSEKIVTKLIELYR
jgi:spore coat polysaccharide biosynthesis predicted glycosyltransferase SpsG